MQTQPDYLIYVGALLAALPSKLHGTAALRAVFQQHADNLRAALLSSDDVLEQERRIEMARTSFVATLRTLTDANCCG
jgi:hypothetical protein